MLVQFCMLCVRAGGGCACVYHVCAYVYYARVWTCVLVCVHIDVHEMWLGERMRCQSCRRNSHIQHVVNVLPASCSGFASTEYESRKVQRDKYKDVVRWDGTTRPTQDGKLPISSLPEMYPPAALPRVGRTRECVGCLLRCVFGS